MSSGVEGDADAHNAPAQPVIAAAGADADAEAIALDFPCTVCDTTGPGTYEVVDGERMFVCNNCRSQMEAGEDLVDADGGNTAAPSAGAKAAKKKKKKKSKKKKQQADNMQAVAGRSFFDDDDSLLEGRSARAESLV